MIPFVTRGARRWLAGLLLIAVLPVSFLRQPFPPVDRSERIAITPVPMPSPAFAKPHLGAFRLEGIWRITSRHPQFGGYSTLQRLRDGEFLTIADTGYALRFSPPGHVARPPHFIDFLQNNRSLKINRDAESSAYDPETGCIWIGWEGSNAISRHFSDLTLDRKVRPPAMRGWDDNTGAESMLRLPDGRFLVLAEDFTGWGEDFEHPALLFPGDPVEKVKPIEFRLSGPEHFSPTDMARLPDGRVLILMRRAVWLMPYRFVGRIVLADPAEIRPNRVWKTKIVAYLSSSLPVDNFEGIVAEPRPDGKVDVWIISDDNNASTQRTLLWKMAVDPKELR